MLDEACSAEDSATAALERIVPVDVLMLDEELSSKSFGVELALSFTLTAVGDLEESPQEMTVARLAIAASENVMFRITIPTGNRLLRTPGSRR